MRLKLPGFLATVLLAACAGRLYSTLNATSSAGPDEAYTCVQDGLKALGYSRAQYDASQHWIVAQRSDSSARVASSLYRRTVHRLDVKVAPRADGQTGVEITAHTFDEFSTQRGFTQEERSAADAVKRDAATLAGRCST